MVYHSPPFLLLLTYRIFLYVAYHYFFKSHSLNHFLNFTIYLFTCLTRSQRASSHPPVPYLYARNGSSWMRLKSGTLLLEPSLLPPRVHISRNLELGVEQTVQKNQHKGWRQPLFLSPRKESFSRQQFHWAKWDLLNTGISCHSIRRGAPKNENLRKWWDKREKIKPIRKPELYS